MKASLEAWEVWALPKANWALPKAGKVEAPSTQPKVQHWSALQEASKAARAAQAVWACLGKAVVERAGQDWEPRQAGQGRTGQAQRPPKPSFAGV